MGLMFDPSEVFQIAVRIEVNGERFYREMAGRLDDEEVKTLFTFLADEEIKHRTFYEEILGQSEPFEPRESYPGEYFDYLRSYASGVIFSQETFEKKLEEIRGASEALDFAIGVEWDSIHFYQELKGLVPESRREQLDALIAEERKHFVQLTKMKRERTV
jgi:rubrerythrin